MFAYELKVLSFFLSLSFPVWVYVYMCVCVRVCVCVHGVYTCVCHCVWAHVCVCIWNIPMGVSVYTCMSMHVKHYGS